MTAINFHDDIFDHIKQFQFYQEEKGRLVFRYIPKTSCNEENLSAVRKHLLVKLGDDIELHLKEVQDIPVKQRGKHRFLTQKLNLRFGDR
jgi:phenylacetate-CoA ligase